MKNKGGRRVIERRECEYKGYNFITAKFQGNYQQHGVISLTRPDGTSIIDQTPAISKNGRYNDIGKSHDRCQVIAKSWINEDVAALNGILTDMKLSELYMSIHTSSLYSLPIDQLREWLSNEYIDGVCQCQKCSYYRK